MIQPDGLPPEYAALSTYEAEQVLLGELMANAKAWPSCAGLVSADDFHTGVHGQIFDRIRILSDAGEKISPLTVAPHFVNSPDLDQVGGKQYLFDLVTGLVVFGNAESCARIIKDRSRRRLFIDEIDSLKTHALDPNQPLSEILSNATRAIEAASDDERDTMAEHAVVEQVVSALLRPIDADATGLTALDEVMWGGLHVGRTYVFAAKEKVGKTTLAHSISYNLNERGVKHAYFALEMGSDQIVQRQLARRLNINSVKFLTERSAAFASQVSIAGLSAPDNVIHCNCAGITFDELRAKVAHIIVRNRNLRGLILDYWQLVEGKEKNETEERFLRRVAQWLADTGKRHNIWVIVIAQLNDAGELFGGRGLKKACDQLYYLHRDQDAEPAWLEMAVTRYGPRGNAGSPTEPAIMFDNRVGPHFRDHWSVPAKFDPSSGEVAT